VSHVRDVRVDVLDVPFRTPIATADDRPAIHRLALIRLISDEGLEGVGEVAGAEPRELLEPIRDDLAGRFIGLDPAEPADLDRRLRAVERHSRIGRALRSALETAALDLAARTAGVSVAASIADRVRPRVPLNGLVGIGAPEAAAREARALAGAGFRCLKLKGGREGPTVLAERVRAVRSAVGAGIRLRLDVNGAWSGQTEAIEAIEALVELDLEYVEQPLSPELGPDALATLRRAVSIPLAADESVSDPKSALALLQAGAADVLVVKPARVGGLRQARRIVDLAALFGISIVVSTLFETGIGIAAALQLAATLADDGREHGLATAGLLASDLLAQPLPIVDGWMTLPSGPGLGVELDPVAVDTFQAR
jgi:L-alanine-DL-glutamate epimerase-like enolase superfamily enzyme